MRKRKQKAVRFLCLLMLGAVLSCMVGCAGKDDSETEQPALESVTYSNLTDAEARTLLSGLLEKSGVIREYFSRYEQKEMKERLAAITKSPEGAMVKEMLDYVNSMLDTITVLITVFS